MHPIATGQGYGVYTISFSPDGRETSVPAGTTLLFAALDVGIFIHARCGGAGTCGGCAVRVLGAAPESAQSLAVLGKERYSAGWRLACDVSITGDMSVDVPVPRISETARPRRAARPAAAPKTADRYSDPPTERHRVSLTAPTHDDSINDLTRVVTGIRKATGSRHVSVSLPLLREIPGIVREHAWDVDVSVSYRGHDMEQACLSGIGRGGAHGPALAIACDIGTTGLWASLLDTGTGQEIGRTSVLNPQIAYGADVITRIVHARTAEGARTLQRAVVEALDGLIGELIGAAGAARESIGHVVAAGNTVMSHLLLGLPTEHLRKAPYVPAACVYPDVPAADLGFNLGPETPLFVFPSVASYVGGDIVAGVLESGLFREAAVTLFIDIGTNGEIVLGNDQWMLTASASAGPAFEGGGVRFGMRGSDGAVEGVFIDDGFEPMITTVGGKRAVGICGSGIINALAALFCAGALLPNGKIGADLPAGRVREGGSGTEYVLVRAEDAGIDEDIVISDADIENVVRAKAAMYAGYRSLAEAAGIGMDEIGGVIISGAFGNFLDIENAVRIGLLPDIPRDRFVFIGNGSLAGARRAALSRSCFRQGLAIARGMTNVELSVDPGYMDRYLAASFIPHTDIDLFPTVRSITAAGRGARRQGASAR